MDIIWILIIILALIACFSWINNSINEVKQRLANIEELLKNKNDQDIIFTEYGEF